MKKYFIYEYYENDPVCQLASGDHRTPYEKLPIILCAKTNRCRTIGSLIGEFTGTTTEKPVTLDCDTFRNGTIGALINGEHVEVWSVKWYN